MKTLKVRFCTVAMSILLITNQFAQGQFQPNFTHDYTGQCPPVTVTFTNTSTGVDTAAGDYFQWWFGNDGPYTVFDTSYTYTQGGGYNVMLQVYDSSGFDIGGWQDDLNIEGVRFSMAADTACPGDEIFFHEDNEGNNPFWDFGDGNTIFTVNPSHIYGAAGNYTVTLIAGEGTVCGIDTITQPIVISNSVVPVADFWGWPNPVCPNDMVDFQPNAAGTFYWDFGDGDLDTTTNPRVSHAYNIVNTYPVTLTVTNGCGLSDSSATDTITVQNGLPFTGQVNFEVSADSACPGDAVSFECWQCDEYAAFSWNFGDGSPLETNDTRPTHSYSSTGTYIITLTVFNGCGNDSTFTDTVVIDNNVAPDPNYYEVMIIPPVACPDDTIIFLIQGGAAYYWDFGDGNTDSATTVLPGTDAVFSLHAYDTAGTYPVIFTLTNGCGNSFTDTFDVYISDSASVFDFGGDGPPGFFWEGLETGEPSLTCEEVYFIALGGGSTFSWDWGDGNNTITNTLYTTHAYNTPGTYTISLFVQNSCSDTATFTANITITGICPFLAATASGSDPTCEGMDNGSATVTVSGGTSPYTYLWDDLASQTGSTATGLSSGTYTVVVTDAAGDTAMASTSLLNQFDIDISLTTVDASCGSNDGVAMASALGGTTPYSFQWSNGVIGAIDTALSAGFYMVTATDNNGCSDFALATISDNDGPTITVFSTTYADCNGNGGSIDIFITGDGPYTYLWSNGSVTQDISNLAAGPYEVYVTDANGCVGLKSINVPGQEAFSLTTSVIDANCGNSNGSATVNISGGTPYSYQWDDGLAQTTETATNLGAGVYSVTVIDDNGCMGSASATVSEIGGATIVIDSVINTACNSSDGSVYITVSGGAFPYTFSWSNDSTTEDLAGVSAGVYGITVTGSDSCKSTASAEISVIQPSVNPICLITVDSTTGTNLIVWEKEQTTGIELYNIYKESTQAGLYYLVGNVPYDSMSVFVDEVSNPQIRSWRYKISAVDECGNESELSEEHKTMHLTINQGLTNINLIWDHYEGFIFGTYYIYRYLPSPGWEEITALPNNLTSYTDDPPSMENLRYQIIIVKPDTCYPTIAKTQSGPYSQSLSNIDEGLMAGIGPDISGQDLPFDVLIYPNPNTGEFTLVMLIPQTQDMVLKITNMLGQQVYSEVLNKIKGHYQKQIDLSQYPKGIYNLQVVSDRALFNKKLIIE